MQYYCTNFLKTTIRDTSGNPYVMPEIAFLTLKLRCPQIKA